MSTMIYRYMTHILSCDTDIASDGLRFVIKQFLKFTNQYLNAKIPGLYITQGRKMS